MLRWWMIGQHGSTFKQHPSYLYHSKGKVHMLFTRLTPVIDTILLLTLKHNIILDVCLFMQEHLPHFCPFLCLNSFIIAWSVLTPILELPYKHRSAGSLQDWETNANDHLKFLSKWHQLLAQVQQEVRNTWSRSCGHHFFYSFGCFLYLSIQR